MLGSSTDDSGMQGSSGRGAGERDEDALRRPQTTNRDREFRDSASESATARGGSEGGTGRGAYLSENLTEDDLAAGGRPGSSGTSRTGAGSESADELDEDRGIGLDSGAMRGSSSGTTGLGGERNRGSTGSPGGVEGMSNKSNPTPDEDLSRNR